jgi:hypothetical protein
MANDHGILDIPGSITAWTTHHGIASWLAAVLQG